MNTRLSRRQLSARLGIAGLLAGAITFGSTGVAFSQTLPGTPIDGSPPFTLTFDEQGNGTLTTPSGSSSAFHTANEYGIQYLLGFRVEPGDVIVTSPHDISPTNPLGLSDNLHFWNDDNLGGLMYYQSLWDDDDTLHDLADVPISNFYATTSDFMVSEIGPEGNNYFVWSVPTPGFSDPTIYYGISDIPEPSTFILGGLGLVALYLIGSRRRRS